MRQGLRIAAIFVVVSAALGDHAYSRERFCVPGTEARTVDLSTRTTPRFLKHMQAIGVSTIARYYDYTNETIRGKTLRKEERDLISSYGMAILTVFQHHNDRFESFTSRRGEQDAIRSLELAKENRQPAGSAVYFGVDGPWGQRKPELKAIREYFKAARAALEGRFRVGVYGSGAVCKDLREQHLVDYCWLANARSWPGYTMLDRAGSWNLKQTIPEDCAGLNVDFNFSEDSADFGQFK